MLSALWFTHRRNISARLSLILVPVIFQRENTCAEKMVSPFVWFHCFLLSALSENTVFESSHINFYYSVLLKLVYWAEWWTGAGWLRNLIGGLGGPVSGKAGPSGNRFLVCPYCPRWSAVHPARASGPHGAIQRHDHPSPLP